MENSIPENANLLDRLVSRIEGRTAVVGIIGMGYVGLPLMLRYAYAGFKVIGFDVDQGKVDKLNQGASYIEHVSRHSIADALERGFEATSKLSRIE